MFNIEGTCDWCKRPRLLTRHDYLDGKSNHSCEECNDIAKIDVRLFNLGEQQMRDRQARAC